MHTPAVVRFVILGFAVVWIIAIVGRFARRLGRAPVRPIRGAQPVAPAPRPEGDRLIGVLRVVLGVVLFLVLAGVLRAATALPDLVILLVAAPVGGLVSALITERLVEDDDPR
ncbi:MAG: hypothetical protein AAGK32_04290 [Actinomycetota bacterium]